MVQKLSVEDDHGNDLKASGSEEDDDDDRNETDESESDEIAEPVDKILKGEHPARFLYKSFFNTDGQKPDFLSYRLPIMFLAIKTEPYFFKVNKIRFKPYRCETEMEFIEIHWPIQLDELYESPYDRFDPKGWSGPMFNEWATKESNNDKSSSYEESASPKTSKGNKSSDGDDAGDDSIIVGDGIDIGTGRNYHRAYIQAEIKPKSQQNRHGLSDSARAFNILIAALVGGVWELEDDPENYTCKHLAEMRTVKEEVLRETRFNRYNRHHQPFFYKRVRMLSNYWQCYLAGETNYLVGVNGLISNNPGASSEENRRREIKELRLYDVSKIPGFIKKCGAEQGFRPWSKEILENRLYKSLCVIYDKVIDAPVGAEFMFVKYNEFDPPVHDIDGSITEPYLLAFRQVILEGLSTPPQPKLLINLMKLSNYEGMVKFFEKRKFTYEDIPKVEDKQNYLILTFKDASLAELFLVMVGDCLRYLKENDKLPADLGLENLKIKKVLMEKPVAPGGGNVQSWRSSNQQPQQSNQWNNDRGKVEPASESTQSWRNFNHEQQQPNSRNSDNGWRREDSAGDNGQLWRSSNQQQQQMNSWNNNRRQQDSPGDSIHSWRNSNRQQQQTSPRHANDGKRSNYSRQMFAPDATSGKKDSNWRQN